MSPKTVHHDPTNQRFEIAHEDIKAVAEYEMEGDRMIFTHTFVPETLRGHGLAADLVRTGLEFARSEKKKVLPRCSYVEVYLKRHPEFGDLL